METFHDEWSPDHPVRWTTNSGTEPDRYLSLDDAVARLARTQGVPARDVRRHLSKPGALWLSMFAAYHHDADPADAE